MNRTGVRFPMGKVPLQLTDLRLMKYLRSTPENTGWIADSNGIRLAVRTQQGSLGSELRWTHLRMQIVHRESPSHKSRGLLAVAHRSGPFSVWIYILMNKRLDLQSPRKFLNTRSMTSPAGRLWKSIDYLAY